VTRAASILTKFGVFTASPLAFGVVLIYAVLWLLFHPESLEWHSVATLATWLMTLVIQRSEHRDTQAIHAKLDNLLKAIGPADASLSTIDDQEPEDVEGYRKSQR
jgi:low affinity Fe/Cu permease